MDDARAGLCHMHRRIPHQRAVSEDPDALLRADRREKRLTRRLALLGGQNSVVSELRRASGECLDPGVAEILAAEGALAVVAMAVTAGRRRLLLRIPHPHIRSHAA